MSGHRWSTGGIHMICEDCRLLPLDSDDVETDCPVNDWGDASMEQVLRDLIPDLYCVPDLDDAVSAIKEDERWEDVVEDAMATYESTAVIGLMHDWGAEQRWPKTQGPEATGHDWVAGKTDDDTVCARCGKEYGND